ncbi:ORF6N domain-containing protein [Taibaiella lutea]|uniref:ORF6N domain-containing protein n=1 Tax=Taibaiella lutea TaxID=2608001 RepID=A0A5M6CBC7_9BACT|nr:ORF6N domain-containing protein [Taibaiella lutea]KAA5532437.1 ORF6N domain-containing protein [Taibaiella lutea]
MELQVIQQRIYEIRGQKVMLDFDLAVLYEVETKVFNQAVKRNNDLFPEDFMFRLTKEEFQDLRSQFVTSKHGGTRYLPFAFTEHGVTMLASVLKSEKARKMNIAIVRAFIALRKMAIQYADVIEQIAQIKERVSNHDAQLNQIYDAIENLLDDEVAKELPKERTPIGFKTKGN